MYKFAIATALAEPAEPEFVAGWGGVDFSTSSTGKFKSGIFTSSTGKFKTGVFTSSTGKFGPGEQLWNMDKTNVNCSGIRGIRELIPEGRNIQEGWKFQKMEIWA